MSREVIIAQGAGFCFGVARATAAVEREIAAHAPGERIFTLGRLIHNEIYTRRLQEGGVEVIGTEDIPRLCGEAREDAPVRVFIRAHGMTAGTEALLHACAAHNPYFTFTDCTCSFVKKIHRICAEQSELCRAAREATGQDDRFLLVLGSADHPEVVGFLSRFEGEKHVFSSAAELESLLRAPGNAVKWGSMTPILVAQTTHNLKEWEMSKKILKNLFTNSLIFDTICSVTESRQQEAAALARECDLIIVIGGRDSSNSAKLFSICKSICADTVWVERAEELQDRIPLSRRMAGTHRKVGVVAGASTPRDIIEEVANNMSEQAQNENFAELLEESALKTIKTGDTVVGIVTAITPGEIQLDLGTKVTGVIKLDQITDDPAAKLDQMFKIGDEVEAFVIRVSDVDGFATLSKKRVDSDKNWKKIEEAYETQETVEGKVILVNKGGVIKQGVSVELDELRQIAYSGKDYLLQLQQRESELTGIPSLKIGYNNVFGYYIEVRNVHKDKVPQEWIRKQTLVNAERYITQELKEYEEKILGAEDKILVLETQLYNELVQALSEFIPAIQINANQLAHVLKSCSFRS